MVCFEMDFVPIPGGPKLAIYYQVASRAAHAHGTPTRFPQSPLMNHKDSPCMSLVWPRGFQLVFAVQDAACLQTGTLAP